MTLEEAWTELHDSTPPGWYVGTPSFNPRRGAGGEWSMYAYDTTEGAHRQAEPRVDGCPPDSGGRYPRDGALPDGAHCRARPDVSDTKQAQTLVLTIDG
jgi:hypothetical protein